MFYYNNNKHNSQNNRHDTGLINTSVAALLPLPPTTDKIQQVSSTNVVDNKEYDSPVPSVIDKSEVGNYEETVEKVGLTAVSSSSSDDPKDSDTAIIMTVGGSKTVCDNNLSNSIKDTQSTQTVTEECEPTFMPPTATKPPPQQHQHNLRYPPSMSVPPPTMRRDGGMLHYIPRHYAPHVNNRPVAQQQYYNNCNHQQRFTPRFQCGGNNRKAYHYYKNFYNGKQQQQRMKFSWHQVLEHDNTPPVVEICDGEEVMKVDAGIFYLSRNNWKTEASAEEVQQQVFKHRLQVQHVPQEVVESDNSLTRQLWQLFYLKQQTDENLAKKHKLRNTIYNLLQV